eukprot:3318346-Karenia_brevis.AAC.1
MSWIFLAVWVLGFGQSILVVSLPLLFGCARARAHARARTCARAKRCSVAPPGLRQRKRG